MWGCGSLVGPALLPQGAGVLEGVSIWPADLEQVTGCRGATSSYIKWGNSSALLGGTHYEMKLLAQNLWLAMWAFCVPHPWVMLGQGLPASSGLGLAGRTDLALNPAAKAHSQ